MRYFAKVFLSFQHLLIKVTFTFTFLPYLLSHFFHKCFSRFFHKCLYCSKKHYFRHENHHLTGQYFWNELVCWYYYNTVNYISLSNKQVHLKNTDLLNGGFRRFWLCRKCICKIARGLCLEGFVFRMATSEVYNFINLYLTNHAS